MKSLTLHKFLPVFILSLALLWGCKQPETVVIGDSPTVAAPSDTADQDINGDDETQFRKLVIGEYQSISSFDPLLADNGATMRALQLIYEGLVRLDADGNPVPAVAKSWEVSSDSLTYTFTLNRNIYYHDSDVFSTGTGRRVAARDVKFIFERMARAGNPPAAANLFWDIKGFESFFREQHNVYEPQKRTLSGVSGIQVQNDSTVVFELHQNDPQFLQKLATPYALIYPREAVNTPQGGFAAVGTGPFTFSSQKTDSAFIFAKSQKYRGAKNILLNRVDILISGSESKLMRQIGKGDIQLLPELGPNMIQNVATNEGDLKQGYTERYTLTTRSNFTEIAIRANPDASITDEDINRLSHLAYANTASYFGQLPNTIVKPDSISSQQPDTTLSVDRLFTVFSDDPFISTYLGDLRKTLNRQGIKLGMTEFRTPTRNTDLWATIHPPLINDKKSKLDDDYPTLFLFRIYPTALQRNEITDLNLNSYSWWLNLRGVSLPTLDKIN